MMSVDVAVVENVTSGAGSASPAGGVFPADGVFVEVRAEVSMLSAAGAGAAAGERVVSVAVVPLSPEAPVWEGRVRPDQVVIASVQRPVPLFWDRVAGSLAAAMVASRETATLRERLEGAQAEHRQWVDAIATSAHAWADENNLCGEFDRFMAEHDLPPRRREFSVECEVTMTTRVSVTVESRSAENAEDDVDREMVARAVGRRIGGFRRHDLELDDFTVRGVQA